MEVNTKKEDFFYEMTLKICSSLEVNTALANTFDYLKKFFPVNECFFQMCDTNLCAIRNVAYTSLDKRFPPTAKSILSMPEDIWEWIIEQEDPYLVYRRSQNLYTKRLANIVGLLENQDLVLPLTISGKAIGVLVLRTAGTETFTELHMDLLYESKAPLSIAMSNALAHEELLHHKELLLDDNKFLSKELNKDIPKIIIGANGGLKDITSMINQVGPLSSTVLILGETGVGKEVIASALHQCSPRRSKPFIKVNCGAIPENLIDSELFGHEKGSFTGAMDRKRGRFERADTGTIFLDEIGELPLAAQVKLLRVIQNQEIERVGGTETIKVDTRIIAATNRNLIDMVKEKTFREDLWFRLNVFPIFIPPLRQRTEDIPDLVMYLMSKKCKLMGISSIPQLAPGSLALLEDYDWPGNVRELENVIERELILSPTGPLTFEKFLPHKIRKNIKIPHSPPENFQSLDTIIAEHIRNALKSSSGKVSGINSASELLNINPSTLRAKLRKYRITVSG